MKKTILTLVLIALTTFSFGQLTTPLTTKKEFKNVIGIDATGLLLQFFNLNTNSYFYYPYMISYKRIFKSNAFRFDVGGNFFNNSETTNDTIGDNRVRNDYNIGIGFEHYSYLSKKWNLFFGADVVLNYTYNDYKYNYTSTLSSRQTTKSFGYGVSPLLGLQFKINSRFSVSTETSYDIIFTSATDSRTQTPTSIYDENSKSDGLQTQFHAPTTINFRIHF